MATTRILALIAFAAFLVFCGVVLAKVPRLDLSVAILIGLGLAAYDLWNQLGPGKRL